MAPATNARTVAAPAVAVERIIEARIGSSGSSARFGLTAKRKR
jgi:hypothetical protein